MQIVDALQLVGSYGFPIVMCLIMAWYISAQTEKNNQRIDMLNQQHKEESEKMTAAINNNTVALQKLIDLVGDSNEV